MATVSDMPALIRQKIAVGARHDALSLDGAFGPCKCTSKREIRDYFDRFSRLYDWL